MTSFFGNNVGRAYIEILADGDRFPESVREEFKDPKAEREYERAGKNHGEHYMEGFNAGRDREFKRGTKDMKDELRNENLLGSYRQTRGVNQGVRSFFDKEGERLARSFRDGFKTGNKDFDRDLDVIGRRAVNRLQQYALESEHGLRRIESLYKEPIKQKLVIEEDETPEDFAKRQQAESDRYAAAIRSRAARINRLMRQERDRYLRDEDKMHTDAQRMLKAFNDEQFTAQVDSLQRRLREFQAGEEEMRRLNAEGTKRMFAEEQAEDARNRRTNLYEMTHDVRRRVQQVMLGNADLIRARQDLITQESWVDRHDIDQRRIYQQAITQLENEGIRRDAETRRANDRASMAEFREVLRNRVSQEIASGAKLTDVRQHLLDIRSRLDRTDLEHHAAVLQQIERVESEHNRRQQAEQDRAGRLLTKKLQKQLSDRAALWDNLSNKKLKKKLLEDLRGSDDSILDKGNRLKENIRQGNFAEAERYTQKLKEINKLLHAGREVKVGPGFDPILRALGKGEIKLKKWDDDVDKLGQSIGKMFGKGSRNNFMNAFGGLIGGITTGALNLPIKLARGFSTLKGDIGAALKEADGFWNKLGSLGAMSVSSFGKALGGLAGAAGAAFGMLNILSLVLGPLASLISGLSAGVVALASTLSFGLIGALVALGPLLLGLGVAFGVVAMAFSGMKGMTKKQKAALLAPLNDVKKQWKATSAEVRKGLFSQLPEQGKLLSKVFKNLNPLLVHTSHTVAGIGTSLLKAFDSKAARRFFGAFDKFLNGAGKGKGGGALGQMGRALSNSLQGVMVMLRLALPYAQKLSTAILNGSRHFREWTNSAKGQSTIKRVFEEAWQSARKVWTTIRLLGAVIRDLLGAGRTTGDTMFDNLNNNLRRFDSWITGKGRSSIQDFFAQVEPLFHAMGNFLGGFGKLFGALDNGQSRSILNGVFTSAGSLFDIIAKLMPQVVGFQQMVGDLAVSVAKAFAPAIALAVQGIGVALHAIVTVATPVISFFGWLLNHLGPLRPILVGVASGVTLIWTAFAAYGAMNTARMAITTFFSTMVGSVRAGISTVITAIQIGSAKVLTAKERLGMAAAGVGIGVGGMALGDSMSNHAAGMAVSTLSGAAGGALIGTSVAPGVGTAVGAAVGATIGFVQSLWHNANDDAKKARDKQIAYMNDVQARADALRDALLSNNQKTMDSMLKVATAATLNTPDKPGGTSATDAALQLGIDPKQLVNYASGQSSDKSTLDAANKKMQADLANYNAGLAKAQQDSIAGGGSADKGAADYNKSHKAQFDEMQRRAGLLNVVNDAMGKQNKALALEIRTTDNLNASMGKLNLGTRGVAEETRAYGTTLSKNSIAGKRNSQFITDHIAAFRNQAAAALNSGKSLGVVDAAYRKNVASLRAQLLAAHFSKDAVDALISSVVKSGGTKLDIQTAAAQAKVNGMQAKLRELQAMKPTPKVKAEISDLEDKIRTAQGKLRSLQDKNVNIHGSVDLVSTIAVHISTNGTNMTVGHQQFYTYATGGILDKPTWLRYNALAGEAGPEAVVPLNRPLSQVDPSVRWLSAIAQGKVPNNRQFPGGKLAAGSTGRNVNIHPGAITVVTPTTDPRAVAAETVNRIAAGILI